MDIEKASRINEKDKEAHAIRRASMDEEEASRINKCNKPQPVHPTSQSFNICVSKGINDGALGTIESIHPLCLTIYSRNFASHSNSEIGQI
jgi:hypothetical protein